MKVKAEDIKKAKQIFLEIFPLQEIDNIEIKNICREFKRNIISFECAMDTLDFYYEYFHNWSYNNRACNFFYGKRS